MDLQDLNNEQREAVKHTNGPLLVVAGAGSGKTRVLTRRIAYLIEKGISPSNIVAITFTNKAAAEMKSRVVSLVGGEASLMVISTFHSFGLRIIRQNTEYFGLTNNFTIFDADDSLSLIKRIMTKFNIDTKIYTPKHFKNRISSLKNEFISPIEFNKYVKSEEDKLLEKVYKDYNNELLNNNSVDFDDLLIFPIYLFKENKDILDKYQEIYKYILIDEYQDTNEAQYILTKLLSSKYQNICVVGDSDQTIYGFRGANYKNILNFEKDYPLCKTIVLNKNYRSTKNILDVSNSVIKNNKERFDKDLESVIGNGDKVIYYRADNGLKELSYICDEIKDINKTDSLDDIVILYRTNAQSRAVEEMMLKRGIPYRIVGSVNFFGRAEIKDLTAYLKVINNQRDSISLLRAINKPRRGIGKKTIEDLILKSEEKKVSLFDAIDSGKALIFKQLINEIKEQSDKLSLTQLVDLIITKSGLKEEIEREEEPDKAEEKIQNLEEFKSITRDFEDKYGIVSLNDFLYEIGLNTDNGDDNELNNRVTLMTIHAVKGLEFNYVFVIGLEDGLFPHINCMNSDSEIEEERRLCYVAMTRAKKRLYLTNAKERILYGNNQNNPVSRFIKEVDEDLLEVVNNNYSDLLFNKKEKKIVKEDYIKENSDDYQIDDYVYHDSFGSGKVVDVQEKVIKVAFKLPFGIRILMKNHVSLRKVR